MKNIFAILTLLLSVSLSAQKYVQEFTKSDGSGIAVSLSDLAFAIPSGTANGSVLVLGPNAKSVYVTDSLQGIVDSSASMLVLFTESYKLNGRNATRDVAVSKQHVKEVIPSGASQTKLRLTSPQATIIINDDYATVAAALSAESGGGGAADGDGVYSGSGTAPPATLVTVTEDAEGDSSDFAIGIFPSWPTLNLDGTERGFYYARNAQNTTGLVAGNTYVNVSTSAVRIDSGTKTVIFNDTDGILLSSLTEIQWGSGSPEGVITARPGSIYLNTAGGAGATFWVKESGNNTNTGWVAK